MKPKPTDPRKGLAAQLERLRLAAGAATPPPPPKTPLRASGEPGGASSGDASRSLLAISLSAAVPLWIVDLDRAGGPSEADMKRCGEFAQELGERGDTLLFGGKPGEAANLFNKLARSIAVLAFCPGGITTFGQHYEAKVKEGA